MVDETPEYGLVMPFLPVTSRGGPYDDDAYVAGYEIGQLDAALAAKPDYHRAVLHVANREQADLIAMRHEYVAVLKDADAEWVHAEFTPTFGEDTSERRTASGADEVRAAIADAARQWLHFSRDADTVAGRVMEHVAPILRERDVADLALEEWRQRAERAEARIKRARDLAYARDDGTVYEHDGHPPNECEPECPGCWGESITAALDGTGGGS